MKAIYFKGMLVFFSLIFLNNIISNANNKDIMPDYTILWKQVEKLEKDNLSKSALEKVEEIYNMALSDNNEQQIVKSTIYRLKYTQILEDDGNEAAILKLEAEISERDEVVKSFMYILLAVMYENYYNNNFYYINNRSITSGFDNNDMKTWDRTKFQQKIIDNFKLALNDDLKKVSIDEYSEFIKFAEQSKNVYPTLYDFVAYYITDKLAGNENDIYYMLKPDEENLTDNRYLSNVKDFINIPETSDNLSKPYAAIEVYKKWLEFRLEDSLNIKAMVNADVRRLNFAKNYLTTSDKNDIWENAINELRKEYNGYPELSVLNYELALYYNTLGEQYYFMDINTIKYKQYKAKAIDLLNDILSRYPQSEYAVRCENLKMDIEKESFSFSIDNNTSHREKIPVRIAFRNADTIYLSVLKCNYNDYLEKNGVGLYDSNISEIKKMSTVVINSEKIIVPKTNDYNEHYTEYLIEPLPQGFYIVVMHANPWLDIKNNFIASSELFVSELSLTNSTSGGSDYYVLNRLTGKPVENANVNVYRYEYDYKKKSNIYTKDAAYKTDKNGYVNIKDSHKDRYSAIRIDVEHGKDFISQRSYISTYGNRQNNSSNIIRFFTDRAIYRPGQTVYFKGICLNTSGETTKIIPDYTTTVKFYDVNRQEISSIDVKSNEFGSFKGSFSIPTGVLTGTFMISSNEGTQYINVEEYKRPMFEVNILPIEGEYRLNDTVYVEGEALTYAGTSLTDAKITYKVSRVSEIGTFYRSINIATKEIYSGETFIEEDGKFRMKFEAIPDPTLNQAMSKQTFYNFIIDVSVTDINGETQTSTTSVKVSNRAISLSDDIGLAVSRESIDSVSINTVNIAGKFVPAVVSVEIFKLKSPDKILTKKHWEPVDIPMYSKEEWYKQYPGYEYNNETDYITWDNDKNVYRKIVNTAENKKIKIEGIEKWTPGVYRISLSSKDKWGNNIVYKKEFELFSEKDKKLPYNIPNFFHTDKTSAQPGDVVNFYLGSSYKDVYVFYQLEVKGEVLKKEVIKINSEIKKIELPIEESYRGGVTANFMFVKNGRLYTQKQPISVEWKNKELNIKFVTFRDKTLPGSKENWKLKISDHLSEPVQAELMTTLYDASLDIFAKNVWSFSVNPYYSSKIYWQTSNFDYQSSSQNNKDFYKEYKQFKLYIPQLELFGLNDYRLNNYRSMEFATMESVDGDAAPSAKQMRKSDLMTVSDDSAASGGVAQNESSVEFGSQQSVQIRKNFEETAFFYPDLLTDENGEIYLSFTMPESLTRWNFMGLAYTKDLKIGNITESIVTRKELMVMPNLPRFFRENDKITISAKINNVSEGSIYGSAKIEFFDPETLESINNRFISGGNLVSFAVEKDGNTNVGWNISIPEGISIIGVRIIAEGENHSDGEERIIPILTNRMLVTESMPLPVRKSGTTNFTMNRLKNSSSSNTLKHSSFTLEYTSNPAWYAVQALPYLMEYPYDCAEQIFSKYYANSLASFIANSDPKIKRVFEIWKNTPDNNTLLSNLEKNQELKSVLLEETPWVMDAKNESERKRRLGLLFDLNRMSSEKNIALRKLNETQQYNGGWAWFKGMPENWYITQHIVCGLGKLNKLGVSNVKDDNTVWEMAKKAIVFIDSQIQESYENLKKNCDSKCMEEDHISDMQIHYLYARSFFANEMPISSSVKEAFEYYGNQAIKYWPKKSFYMQGMIAISLDRFGYSKTPEKIVASLKEHSLKDKELGMYWKYNTGYYWYQAPIETQSLLIEVFDEVANDQESVEEMKVWLLKQKQTQDWKTTKATSEAIYALLLRGTDLLAETDIPVIKIGNMTLDVSSDEDLKTEAGTGYFKKSWDGSQIKSDWGDISVTKKTKSVSWGAVYWQYFEQLDKITGFEDTPLKINKKLFVERMDGSNRVIVPIENDSLISLGDKIKVRIEIRSDRDMEYVHLKDMRGSCFEPVDYISGYRYKSGIGYYQSIKDASMNFFIDYLRKGTYVFEYELVVSQKGDFSNGITTIQCMYAPEFSSHSEGIRVVIE